MTDTATPDQITDDYPADALALAVRAAHQCTELLTTAGVWMRPELTIDYIHYGPLAGRSVGTPWLALTTTITVVSVTSGGELG